jgi:alkanesulfonate monooxygenase SsuD/methylene tetrahydromethanopterin reductase-like flavin-dependent oxidoreductase (luciferase family)
VVIGYTLTLAQLSHYGTPINDRCYSKEELAKAMHKVADYAKCMDERGYDTFWMAEHHFQPEGTELPAFRDTRTAVAAQ